MQDKNDSEEVLTVRIGCEKHDVDAETIISLMQATVGLIQTANRTVCPKDVLQVKVSPFVPGSFEILFNLIVPSSVVLLEKAPIIASTLSIFKNYLSIRKWFHGTQQPEKIEPGTNVFGDQKIEVNAETVNVYQNCQVKQDFSVFSPRSLFRKSILTSFTASRSSNFRFGLRRRLFGSWTTR